MQSVTLKQIAASIGVSERLAAYALNGTGRVGHDTRQRIIEEAQRLGYRPSRTARALATGRSGTVALCLPQLATAYGDAITRIAEANARRYGFDLVVTRMKGYAEPTVEPLLPAGLTQVDGALLLEPPRLPSATELAVVRNPVIIGVFDEVGIDAFDHVRVDIAKAATNAVEALLQSNPKKFVFVTVVDFGASPREARFKAYLGGVARLGQEPTVIMVNRTEDLMAEGATALLRHCEQSECPDAIMCSNDEIAIGALRAMRTLGLKVSLDVVVTGCDGIAFAEDACPPLSTIAQPFTEMLDRAWDYLMARIETPDGVPQQSVIPAKFVVRASSGVL